jgi:2-polyprenyl-3-methyl-5-hydroxy-6-metoxy-1,4-benzoquinol methylase
VSENLVENYGWDTAESPQSCNYVTPAILEVLARHRPPRVLDLGCGNGQLCAQIRQAGYEVAGMEYDKAGVGIARASHPEIPFFQFGVQDDPARLLAAEGRGRFDAVVSTEVVEHLFAPHLLPQYASAVLREGGLLLVTTPYHGYLKNLALALFGKWDYHHTALWHGGHIKFWSRATLAQLLHENGFDVIEFHGVGRTTLLWKSMLLVARKRG